ncbi:MAG: phage scaffolding protein [Clostridia bacterium]|nr:phage scaffolding protein [Clostridia bacterium]
MTKEQLLELGLTEEQTDKVLESLDGNFVTKSRFNELNDTKKQLEKDIAARDAQLEALKNSAGDAETMKQTIMELQTQNAKDKAEYEAKIKQLRIDNAIEKALSEAKAKNIKAVRALLDLEKAELDGETIKGLDEQIKKLKDGVDTGFLFDAKQEPQKPKLKGFKPAEKADKTPSDTAPESLADAVKLHFETKE